MITKKIDYQSEDIHLRGNVIVDSIYGYGSVVNAGKFKMRTGATNGYIPVSDSDGEMTWTDPSSITAWYSNRSYGATGQNGRWCGRNKWY